MTTLNPRTTNILIDILSKTHPTELDMIIKKAKEKQTIKFDYSPTPSATTDWNIIKAELEAILGKASFAYFNDKRKKFRRIKLFYLADSSTFLKFMAKRYPHIQVYHSNNYDKSKSFRNYYDGYCFKLPL